MQKINILGVELTDYSLKESLLRLDGYVRGGGLNTILYITTPVLIMAGENEEEKKEIESMDMTLCEKAAQKGRSVWISLHYLWGLPSQEPSTK